MKEEVAQSHSFVSPEQSGQATPVQHALPADPACTSARPPKVPGPREENLGLQSVLPKGAVTATLDRGAAVKRRGQPGAAAPHTTASHRLPLPHSLPAPGRAQRRLAKLPPRLSQAGRTPRTAAGCCAAARRRAAAALRQSARRGSPAGAHLGLGCQQPPAAWGQARARPLLSTGRVGV